MEADKGEQIMAKEKKQKQIHLEEITALTKELFHAHYAGDLERWFDYLCPDSIPRHRRANALWRQRDTGTFQGL